MRHRGPSKSGGRSSAPLWELGTEIVCRATLKSILVPNYHSRADYLLYLTREGGAARVKLHAAVLRLIHHQVAAIIAAILVNPYVNILEIFYVE